MESKIETNNSLCTRRATHWLYKAGLRPTQQRVSLAKLLIGNGEYQHVTAENLFEKAKLKNINVSLATIYNTLHAFSHAGLINEVIVDGTRSYFDTRVDNHPHFYWEETGELIDAPGEFLEIKNLPSPPENSEITNINIVMRLRHKIK